MGAGAVGAAAGGDAAVVEAEMSTFYSVCALLPLVVRLLMAVVSKL